MPISVNAECLALSQKEFGKIAYAVVHEAFAVHELLGPLFDEKVYPKLAGDDLFVLNS